MPHCYGKLMCHTASHSVTCHLAEVRIPPLPPAKAGTRFSDLRGMQGWVDLYYVKSDRLGIEPATYQLQVQRPTTAPQCNTKGKEQYIYIALFILLIVSKCSDMDHTVLPANYTMPAFTLVMMALLLIQWIWHCQSFITLTLRTNWEMWIGGSEECEWGLINSDSAYRWRTYSSKIKWNKVIRGFA